MSPAKHWSDKAQSILVGRTIVAALRVLGNGSDADKVEEMIKRVRNMTLEVQS